MKRLALLAVIAVFVLVGCGGGGGGGGGGSICPSIYNGTYTGQFIYEYQTTAIPPQTVTGNFQLTVQLSCVGIANGIIAHFVTSATNSDPYFGCQGGCSLSPNSGSFFNLPEHPPTTPSNPSERGEGLAIQFPNKTLLVTSNFAGNLNVSADGRHLSNSLDPSIENSTWGAESLSLPPKYFLPDAINIKYKSWSLTKN